MKFRVHSYRHAGYLFSSLEEYAEEWHEVIDALDSISDQMIALEFQNSKRKAKSISEAINRLVKKEMGKRGWNAESFIFADPEYAAKAKGTWRLDFAKNNLSMEVAFNHRSDISWNLIKPTLASELNHVDKALQTSGGIIVCATEDMKAAGGFDNAIGTFEDYVQYLRPMGNILSVPLAIIGLEPPESFHVEHKKVGNTMQGQIIWQHIALPESQD